MPPAKGTQRAPRSLLNVHVWPVIVSSSTALLPTAVTENRPGDITNGAGPGRVSGWELTCDGYQMSKCRTEALAHCPHGYDTISENESSADGIRHRSMRVTCRTESEAQHWGLG